MIGVEIVKDGGGKEPAVEEAKLIRKLCADRGLIVGLGGWWLNVIRIQPPMTINADHVARALDVIEKAVGGVQADKRAAA